MKYVKRTLALLFILGMVVSFGTIKVEAATVASGTCGNDATWSLDDKGTLLISGVGDTNSLLDMDDYREQIIKVVIEEGITGIGNSAFQNCTNMTSVTIPNSVVAIGQRVFYECSSLIGVIIPDSVTSIGDSAFWGCESLANIDLPCGITTILDSTFYGCEKLTAITIPDGVTTIESSAFGFCDSLISINIPASVTYIGEEVFKNCDSMTGIYVDDNNPNYSNDAYGALLDKGMTTLIQVPCGINGEYIIPDTVTTIGRQAIFSCNDLTSVTIPHSVTSISSYAFAYCDQLTTMTIPDSVASIGSWAFEGCSSLISVTLPNSITTIPSGTFTNCVSLTDVAIPGSIQSIGHLSFAGCSKLSSIVIPNSVTSIDREAFTYCNGLTSITFTGDAPSISKDAFYNVTATAYYPAGNDTWTADVMQDYGGTITWEPYSVSTAQLVVDTTSARAGETVTVAVSIQNNPGFGGMAYNVCFDGTVLELISYELGLGSDICVDSGVGTYSNKVNFQYAGTSNFTGDEALVTFTFKVKDTAEAGLTEITVIPEDGTVFRYEGRTEVDFILTAVNGGVEIVDYLMGDVNDDGKINNRDAARILQYLAGWDVDFVEAAADVTGDGKVNNRDAARILQYLAGWDVTIN